jgi:hypothetical protein
VRTAVRTCATSAQSTYVGPLQCKSTPHQGPRARRPSERLPRRRTLTLTEHRRQEAGVLCHTAQLTQGRGLLTPCHLRDLCDNLSLMGERGSIFALSAIGPGGSAGILGLVTDSRVKVAGVAALHCGRVGIFWAHAGPDRRSHGASHVVPQAGAPATTPRPCSRQPRRRTACSRRRGTR